MPRPLPVRRPTGLEPGLGYVHVEVSQFERFEVFEFFQGVDTLTRARGSDLGFASSGTLEISEVVDGERLETRFEQVLLTENAIEVATVTDD